MVHKKPKILFILHLPPPVHGAAMMGQFVKESKFINSEFDGTYLNLGTSSTIDDIGKNGLKKLFRYVCIIFQAFRLRFSHRPDLIYMTIAAKGAGFYKDALLVLLLKLFSKRFVFHFHNKGVATNQDKFLDNWLYRRVFRGSHVILLSEHLYTDIQKFVPPTHVHFCPNGIEEIHFPESNSAKSKFEFLIIGNLAESKGILDAINAFEVLKAAQYEFHCTIIGGEGKMSANELISYIDSKNLINNISYVGKQFDSAKAQFLSNSNVLIHPSHEECFPLVLLEAMNAGKPVISTYEGGIPDIVENNVTGFLIKKKDTSALINCMEILISQPEILKEMGSKAKEKFLHSFTIAHFESKFVSILNTINDEY